MFFENWKKGHEKKISNNFKNFNFPATLMLYLIARTNWKVWMNWIFISWYRANRMWFFITITNYSIKESKIMKNNGMFVIFFGSFDESRNFIRKEHRECWMEAAHKCFQWWNHWLPRYDVPKRCMISQKLCIFQVENTIKIRKSKI